MGRTQSAVNILLMCLCESIPSSKRDVYDETVNFIKDLSIENDGLKKELVALQKQLDAAKKKKT